MDYRFFIVICILMGSCADETPFEGPWTVSGSVKWYGSSDHVEGAEVIVTDPNKRFNDFITAKFTDDYGRYSISLKEKRKSIELDATLDGRQYLVDLKRDGEPSGGRLKDLSPRTEVDLYLQAFGLLNISMDRDSLEFAYGNVIGRIDSFTFFPMELPSQRTLKVFAEHQDSFRVIAYDFEERRILDEFWRFRIKNDEILDVEFDI